MPELVPHDAGNPPLTVVPVEAAGVPGQLLLPPAAIGLALIGRVEHGGPAADAYTVIGRAFLEKGFASLLIAIDASGEGAANTAPAWLRGDVAQMAERIAAAIRWASAEPRTAALRIGLFGVDLVAAAALVAAADAPLHVAAVAACHARTDLVDRALGRIAVPVLLIAGARATDVLTANRAALVEMRCEKRMVIAAGNLKHSLEGRGARRVGNLAARWFDRHLASQSPGSMR